MLDIGWAEMAVIAVVALIVLGPRELPKVLRTVGQWVGKARALAREFQDGINQIAEEAELDDVKRRIDALGNDALGNVDIKREIESSIDPTGGVPTTQNSIGGGGAEVDVGSGDQAAAEEDGHDSAQPQPEKRTDS